MSANNSRLSPRQKMINLMYIVFLAMVAMNVSGDVLEGFKHVEDALDASNAGAQSRNQKLYQEFDLAREKNPEKVSRWYNHAQEVRTSAEQLVAFLDSLKLEIVRYADGKDGDPNDIENRENLEAVNQVMLSPIKGEGAILRLPQHVKDRLDVRHLGRPDVRKYPRRCCRHHSCQIAGRCP